GLLPALPLLELALRERPVHVLGPMDHHDPGLPILAGGEQHAPGRANVRAAVPDLEVLAAHRRSVLAAAPATRNTIAAGARSASPSRRSPPTPASARSSGGRAGRSSPTFAPDRTTTRCSARSTAPTRSRSTRRSAGRTSSSRR